MTLFLLRRFTPLFSDISAIVISFMIFTIYLRFSLIIFCHYCDAAISILMADYAITPLLFRHCHIDLLIDGKEKPGWHAIIDGRQPIYFTLHYYYAADIFDFTPLFIYYFHSDIRHCHYIIYLLRHWVITLTFRQPFSLIRCITFIDWFATPFITPPYFTPFRRWYIYAIRRRYFATIRCRIIYEILLPLIIDWLRPIFRRRHLFFLSLFSFSLRLFFDFLILIDTPLRHSLTAAHLIFDIYLIATTPLLFSAIADAADASLMPYYFSPLPMLSLSRWLFSIFAAADFTPPDHFDLFSRHAYWWWYISPPSFAADWYAFDIDCIELRHYAIDYASAIIITPPLLLIFAIYWCDITIFTLPFH